MALHYWITIVRFFTGHPLRTKVQHAPKFGYGPRTLAAVLLAASNVAFCCVAVQADPASVCRARESALDALIPCLKAEFAKLASTQPAACDGSASIHVARGRRALGFGETAFGKPSKGIAVETNAGAALQAPASGRILFAGEWRSFGPLVIIDAGCGRDVLMMGPVALGVVGGEDIARGDAIGHVSAPDGGVQPVIYYELRQDGTAVDPGR